jgi:hypothetical protein
MVNAIYTIAGGVACATAIAVLVYLISFLL